MTILKAAPYAEDQSTFVVDASFFNEAGVAVIPISASWTLTNGDGTAVNSRTSVAISPLAASVSIVLTGADLKYSDGPERVLTVAALYNSTLGTGLSLRSSLRFPIADLISGKIGE